jgi:hypothetical protein
MSVKISVAAVAPFTFPTNIVNDAYPPTDPEAGPGADIESIFANSDIDFDITFTYEETVEEGEESTTITAPVLSVELVGDLPVDGGEFTVVSADTIKISGRSTGIFTDEIFRFLFNDKSEKNLLPDNDEPWLTIIKWDKPAQTEKLLNYTFKVTYDDGGDVQNPIPAGDTEVALTQFAYWNFVPSLEVFGSLVEEGGERLKTVKEDNPITRYPNP